LNFFLSKYRHIKRYRQIIRIISKHGLDYILEAFNLKAGFRLPWKKSESNTVPKNTAERLRIVLEELGPAFIKLGQLLSTRSDILPPQYIQQLELLQDNVSPEKFAVIKSTLESEFPVPLSEVFARIDEQPLASASIGQVHYGVLLNDQVVVIKIQRPGIYPKIMMDLEIMSDAANFIENRTDWGKQIKPTQIIAEFARSIREELDYTSEASHAERVRLNFRDDPNVKVPKIFWNLTTDKVLVMEYIEGVKITAPDLNKIALNKSKIAQNLTSAVIKQIMIHGFFHADLHPGNIIITPEGAVAFIDFGMMGRVDDWTRDHLISLFLKLSNKDINGLINTMIDLGYTEKTIDRKGLRRDLFFLLDKYYSRQLNEIKTSVLIQEIMQLAFDYHLILPRDLILVARTLIVLESTVKRLDPTLNWVSLAKPLGRKLLQTTLAPDYLLKKSRAYLNNFSDVIWRLPDSLQSILGKIEAGKFQITLDHRNFDQFINRLNLVGNRVAFSLVVAAIIIGTSLIVQRIQASFLWQFPIAEASFILAVFLGLWLIISIIRSGRI